jgi:hypothetical protein
MKKNVFLLMGLAALLIVGLSSCSKDDDDDNGNDNSNYSNSIVGGAWHKEEVVKMGDNTLHYYDVYNDDGTMLEYLVWFDDKDKFTSSEYKEYEWKIEDGLYSLKQKGDPAFTYEIQFEIKDNKFYFFSAIDNTPILIATRVDLSEIQNYIEKATPAL